jgi:hypothetical protein
MKKARAVWAMFVLFLALAPAALAQPRPHWVASWATAQMVPTNENVAPDADLTDATLRQVVRISLGGRQLRVRLSNAFGNAPLAIERREHRPLGGQRNGEDRPGGASSG